MARVLILGGRSHVGDAIMRALAASREFAPVAGLPLSPLPSYKIAHRICDSRNGADRLRRVFRADDRAGLAGALWWFLDTATSDEEPAA